MDMDIENKFIPDGQTDVAIRKDSERMLVEVDGRMLYRKVYLHVQTASEKKGSTATYQPVQDGPIAFPAATSQTLLRNELLAGPNTKEYMEVGIVIGDDPEKYIAKGNGNALSHKHKRQKRGDLPRSQNAMRVFIPVTSHIVDQANLYVGCNPIDERLQARIISSHLVFFYSEFHNHPDKVLDTTTTKERLKFFMNNCKFWAATKKVPAGRSSVRIVTDDLSELASETPLAVTTQDNLASTTALNHATWQLSGQDPSYLKVIEDLLNSADSDLRRGPHASNEGLTAFLNFEEDMSIESAHRVVSELKVNFNASRW